MASKQFQPVVKFIEMTEVNGFSKTMPKEKFVFTHWACFDCRKSFAKEPVGREGTPRKCPDCAKMMTDMGAYFEPPRRLSKKRWEVIKVLADYGYKFNSECAKAYIKTFILRQKIRELSMSSKESNRKN